MNLLQLNLMHVEPYKLSELESTFIEIINKKKQQISSSVVYIDIQQ